MATLTKYSSSVNEKNLEELINDIRDWNKRLQISSDEFTFLAQFISADIFRQDIPNLFENLFSYSNTLNALKSEKIELHQSISNHKNDLNGMLECEDISCETFYYGQHEKLEDRLLKFISDFNYYQTDFFKFCTNKLRIND